MLIKIINYYKVKGGKDKEAGFGVEGKGAVYRERS